MQAFKFLSIVLALYLMSPSTIFAGEEQNPFIALLENIDSEDQEILSALHAVKLEREKAVAEQQRIQAEKEKIQREKERVQAEQQRIAEAKREEEQRIKEEKADRERLAAEKKKHEALLKAQEEKIAEEKRKNRQLTAHIDLSKQQMQVFKGDELLYKWRVSTARKGYVTPVGSYQPQYLEKMHYSRLYHNSPMPHSIFFKGNFAIHGTNSIRRLGRRASHGCVRLHPKNAKKLYSLIQLHGKKNTLIKIIY
ncbi:MAG: L,D-transpeptidase family protein [Campylobacterota bacterium]|nr:L,D-transpeptidase family protein [Campylobacterota bacterium]